MTKKQNIDLELLKKKLQNIEFEVKDILRLMAGKDVDNSSNQEELKKKAEKQAFVSDDEKIIEGVFNGQNMIGPDEKMYPVPANYASKSKLVEGDVLKLTIAPDGTFVFKQIGPVDRDKKIGTVKYIGQDECVVETEDNTYKILLASATYFKLVDGDTVTIVVPKDKKCEWAAIENVIKKAS